ncbi:MAG: arginine--tRNA ligase [Patescibacteria group bacterium]|nr:arginine--tRNA ligase [Patescibacteria group bacterium]
MNLIKVAIAKLLTAAGVTGAIDFSSPPKPELGDLAFACFDLAKEQKINPAEAAKNLAGKIKPGGLVEKTEAMGSYVNFYLNAPELAKFILSGKKIARKSGKKIMVEYSQPNTHKEFHVGHLRNACIGGAVVELLKQTGNKVIAANYIGDIGAHVAKCLWYIKKFKADEMPTDNLGGWLGKMYTESAQKLEANPEYKNEVDEVLRNLESRDKEWTEFWAKTRAASLDEFKRIYKLLGNNFDVWFFESEEEKRGKEIVGELLKKGVAKKGEGGAIIVDLSEYGLDIFLVLKSDGSSLYSTKDLALTEKKFKKYKVDESVVIIDSRQGFYFKQLFKTLELAGWKKQLVCLTYEFVRLPEGAMSSRHGNVILFEDIYNEVLSAVKNEVVSRHADWDEKKAVDTAHVVTLAAIKFDMLKHPTDKVIEFNVKEAMSFDGCTGPYILYTVARISSMLRKAGVKKINAGRELALLTAVEEKKLALKIGEFDEAIVRAAEKLNPSVITKYAYDLAKVYSEFYTNCQVLDNDDEKLTEARLALSLAAKNTLQNTLKLLLIETVEEM